MSSEGVSLLIFGCLALLVLFIGFKRGFFKFQAEPWDVPIQLLHVAGAFGLYFLTSYLFSTLAILWLKKHPGADLMAFSSLLNFGVSFLIFLLLIVYFKVIPREVRCGILWKNRFFKEDIQSALYAWLLSFPLVLFLSQGLERLVAYISGLSQVPDQIAVKFLKLTLDDPLYFILATLSIIILAPLVEETLFRGFLQSFIRKHLGQKQAILITSVCFSLFHYSRAQGLGNISIIFPLFVLALFLGFIYEKQRSLLAPVVLHFAFNTITVINLYLFGKI